MKEKVCVVMGDVISSRMIKDREKFQKKLKEVCEDINTAYAGNIYANFKILKGIDEIEGVLFTVSGIYEIISAISEHLYPYSMRFVLVFDYVDTALDTGDVAKMDGPAFNRASDIMGRLKKSGLIFDMSAGDELMDGAIAGEINLIFLIKKYWSAKQHQITREYKKLGNQYEVAKKMGITQQAVSKTLSRCMWKEINIIEENLNHTLRGYGNSCRVER